MNTARGSSRNGPSKGKPAPLSLRDPRRPPPPIGGPGRRVTTSGPITSATPAAHEFPVHAGPAWPQAVPALHATPALQTAVPALAYAGPAYNQAVPAPTVAEPALVYAGPAYYQAVPAGICAPSMPFLDDYPMEMDPEAARRAEVTKDMVRFKNWLDTKEDKWNKAIVARPPRRARQDSNDEEPGSTMQLVAKKTPAHRSPSASAPTERDDNTANSPESRPTFADAARSPHASPPPSDAPKTHTGASQGAMKKPRLPPFIVEHLPNWPIHLRQLRDALMRTPNARPFGRGIKFSPTDDQEYRLVQQYLTELERAEGINWFTYSLPQERSQKVAIRGLPLNTAEEELAQELRARGYEPELVRPIKARKGRPGCIFLGIMKRTPNIQEIFKTRELLGMPGVRIEGWRGKRGPAQCHRCQQFRHSSFQCHRTRACVRCGEPHAAFQCTRPKEDPATCANCGGPHTANSQTCPVYKKEARNKRAGTVPEENIPQAGRRHPRKNASVPESTTIRTPANDATPRGENNKKRNKKRKTRRRKPNTDNAPPLNMNTTQTPNENPKAKEEGKTTEADPARDLLANHLKEEATVIALQALKEVLQALQVGADPVKAVLRAIEKIVKMESTQKK